MESEVLARHGFKQVSIGVEGLIGRGWKRGFAVLAKLPLSLFESISVIRGFSPHVVLGVGGYSAGPVCFAAKLLGVPCAIQEQNSFPGLTNRLLCRLVDRVFISFEESENCFPCRSVFLTGNPVRKELLRAVESEQRKEKGFSILVLGGSQGARAVNEAFVSALELIARTGRTPQVIHQTGEADYAHVVEVYERKNLSAKIVPFIQDMGAAFDFADVVVSRAGATTISELAAVGKPSILIPYPYAANRHQELNARALIKVGGAEMILQHNLTGGSLADLLMKYMDRGQDLKRMGERAKGMGRPNAAGVIVDHLMEMIEA